MILDSNENKEKILKEFLEISQIEGWSLEALKKAIKNSEIDEKFHSLIFENGIADLIEFYIDFYNEKMAAEINKIADFHNKKIREKIKIAVFTRFQIEKNNKIAIQRLTSFFVNHKNFSFSELAVEPLFFSLKSCYKIADAIWFAINDQSTDFNFYTKRLILSKIILRTIFVFLRDETKDLSKTSDFIDSQIAKVMKFETMKFQVKNFIKDTKESAQNICFNENGDLKSVKNFLKNLPFIRLIKK